MGDDFGDFGDGGDFGDDGDQYDGQDDSDQDQDDQGDDDQDGGDGGDDGGGNGDDGPNGDDGDDGENLDDMFASGDDLPPLDDDVFQSASDFPNADASDFEDDPGDWTAADYQESAQNLFGDHEFFGDNLIQQKTDEGFQPFADERFTQAFDELAPGAGETVHLFERDGRLFAFGLLSQAALELLMARYTGIDMSNVEVAVPQKGEPAPPEPLPPAFADVAEQDAVDLRKYCTPIGDQGQTGRCSAFAWTHAVEMSRNILQEDSPRLSPNFTMLEFQQMQGDAQDYQYAYSGGDGTISGPDPGRVLVANGTCRQDLWPDDRDRPAAAERQLEADAERYRLEAVPLPIALEDVRKVLSAGCPVHVSMNTGTAFSDVGRDGLFNAAEAPWGRHGRHAMLMVGYTGNFFILKNSWGTGWGDQGYCYVPKNVLAASGPEFIAVLLKKL
ncbi:MAG TPA: C1 family peptidase [Bryobacteraceae bacterium]|nr:C1 family peptidase [Bryobacteraceae bacterium]